jgi:hypothetical protein
MKVYRTNLIININQEKIFNLNQFAGVKFILKPEPSMCFWQSNDGMTEIKYSSPSEFEKNPNNFIPQNELLIEAESEEIAEDVLSIVHGGILLAYPYPTINKDLCYVIEYKEEYNKLYIEDTFSNNLRKINNLGFGCFVTQNIFTEQKAVYSIEKYKISLELASFNPHSIDPKYGQYFELFDIKRQFHTRAAFAIIAAFSVIEELGLEIRSSSKKPRFLDPNMGTWNPDVHGDIQKRLLEANIDETKTFDWVYRGSKTRIEQEIKPFFGFDSDWVIYGEDVRDKTLSLPEAIHNASYLRNYISAHKFNELTQFISPYDVYNVQALARMLILHKYGFWGKIFHKK